MQVLPSGRGFPMVRGSSTRSHLRECRGPRQGGASRPRWASKQDLEQEDLELEELEGLLHMHSSPSRHPPCILQAHQAEAGQHHHQQEEGDGPIRGEASAAAAGARAEVALVGHLALSGSQRQRGATGNRL